MPRIPLFVVAIALANFLVPLNSTAIVAALPRVAHDLAVDRATASWLVTAYLIAMAALQPIGGRIGDRFCRRRLLLGSLAGFLVASALAPLATDFTALVAFRLLQAVCAAAVAPNAMGLLRGETAEGRAGMYFGIVGATAGLGASVGPLLGGILASIDWRWIFAMNVPLVAAIIALGWSRFPRSVPHRTARPDVIGAVSLGVLLSLAAWAISEMDSGPSLPQLALAAAAAAGLAILFRYEARHPDPALPPSLFGIRAFSAANATIALTNLALYGTFIAVPIALASDPASSVRAGLVLTSMSIGLIVLSPISGALVDRFGARVPTAVGGVLIAIGLALPAALGRAADVTTLLICLPIAGAGVAMNFPATRIAALDAAPARLASLASGVTSTSRYFGGMVGSLAAGLTLGRATDLAALPTLLVAFAAAGLASAAVGAATLHGAGAHVSHEVGEPGAAD